MPDDVLAYGDVFDGRPGGGAVLIADGELHGEAGLRGQPDIFEDIALDQHAAGVLELEQVLDGSPDAAPARGLEEVVSADLDIRRHEVGDRRVGAAEHDVFAGGLEVVVHDLEWAGAVPAHDGLGVEVLILEVGEGGIDDGEGFAVERYPSAAGLTGVAVDVAAVDDDVVREQSLARFAPGPELDEAVGEGTGERFDLEADEPEMMRARGRADRAAHVPFHHDLGHDGGVRRGRARARGGEATVRGNGPGGRPAP